jgi:hypothetical protein
VAFQALLGALADSPALAADRVRHFIEHTFTRHNPTPDPLRDPYHLPPYGGRPEELFIDNWTRHDASGRFESATAEHDAEGTIYGRQYLGPETTWYYDATQSQASRLHTANLPLPNRINQDQALVLDLLARGGSRLTTLPDGTRVISQSQPLLETRYSTLLRAQEQDPNAGGPYLLDLASDAMITTRLYLGDNGRPQRIETWATSAAATTIMRDAGAQKGILLESWELASDDQLAADRVASQIFDTDPPTALTLWDDKAEQQAAVLPEPRSVTITEALTLAQSPLFVPQGAGQTPPLIEVGERVATDVGMWGNDIFDGALRRGVAIRFTYWLTTGTALDRLMYIYEGDASSFGAFLQARSTWGWRWLSSEPVQIALDGRAVSGWRVNLPEGATWTLFEVDGTLLAAQTNDPVQQAALERLALLHHP